MTVSQIKVQEVIEWQGQLFERTNPNCEEGSKEVVYCTGIFIIGTDGKFYEHKNVDHFPPYTQHAQEKLVAQIKERGYLNPEYWVEVTQEEVDGVLYPYGKTSEEIARNNYEWELQQGLEGREGYC